MMTHVSVQNLAKGPVSLTLCQTCCHKYHCPFCLPAVFKPTECYASVCTHIESHRLKAVLHREFTIFICHLECCKMKHFHCPYCPKTCINRATFLKHLVKCEKSVIPSLTIQKLQDTATVAPDMEGDRMDVSHQNQSIHVEVHVKSHSTAKRSDVRTHVLALLNRHSTVFGNQKWRDFDEEYLKKHVESVAVVDEEEMPVDLKNSTVSLHIFTLNDDGPSTLNLEENEELSAANHWLLPAAEFNGIWESLVYEDGVKTQLLDYVSTTIFFSDKNVDSNLIAWNRVVLLHGPPGTGKTSLCKALAQKLSIRLSNRYSYGQFVEINSHSLFSKWFSESGKLVTKMFQKIQQLIDDKDALVFVLIDEVESLTAARNASQAGTEPSDAIRVVNSVLTQLDQIKRHPNVVILTTSNVTEKIDLAFVDRADIKQYIGPPSVKGIYNIYLSCLEELMKCQIIYPRRQLFNMFELETMDFAESEVSEHSLILRNIALKSVGLSGRTLRKLPFLAHALFVKMPTVTLGCFLEAMDKAVAKQKVEKANLANSF